MQRQLAAALNWLPDAIANPLVPWLPAAVIAAAADQLRQAEARAIAAARLQLRLAELAARIDQLQQEAG